MCALLTKESQVTQAKPWGSFIRDPILNGYALTEEAEYYIDQNRAIIPKLVSVVLEARLRGESRNVVMFEKTGPAELDPKHNWVVSVGELLSAYPSDPSDMFDRALLNLRRRVHWPGDQIRLSGLDHHLIYATDLVQADWMIRQLEGMGYIKAHDDADMNHLPSLTIENGGWTRLAALGRQPSPFGREAFVAMSFDPTMRPYFEDGIRPAVEADGRTQCVRIDAVHHNNKICDEIIAAIRRSRYVVADFTGNRGGVYYEAGFAHGLGIPVIWTVKDSAKDLHFDTRQYNHIVYKEPEDLRAQLQARIGATIPSM